MARRTWPCLMTAVGLPALAGLLLAAPGVRHAAAATSGPTYVYFDQNEEEEFYQVGQPAYRGLATRQIVPMWDTNGQVCVLPDGRFTSGYNPTGVEQKGNDAKTQNAGARLPRKQPAVGVAIYNKDGSFSGQDLYVPGPYKLTPASTQWTKYGVVGPDAGGDVPPDKGTGFYNSNGTFTGCALGRNNNLFAVDLGTSQGSFPPADDGRLLEWFAPDYSKVCIVYGPTSGGDTATSHHVDGHGGLQQPGIMAADKDGNIYVPSVTTDPGNPLPVPVGKILKFAAGDLPASPAQCPGSNGDQSNYHVASPSTFISTTQYAMPFPQSIARDPVCQCWAVANVLNQEPGPAIAWFDDSGNSVTPDKHLPIPANYGGSQFSPFGMAFDPQGDLFVVDIHVQVDAAGSIKSQSFQAGPVDAQGQLLEFTFSGPVANPPQAIAGGEFFPVAVTTCTPSATQVCPAPPGVGQSSAQSGSGADGSPSNQAPPGVTTLPNTSSSAAGQLAASLLAIALFGLIARRRRR